MKKFNTMEWLSVMIILICICETVKGIAPGCSDCKCCVQEICEQKDYCTHGCTDGIWGNKCYNKCPYYCKACTRNKDWTGSEFVHHCTKCPDGKYIDNRNKHCSLQCPKRCKTCVSFTNCTECYSPHYNMESVTNCSITCPVNCEVCSSPGICSICKDGYFNPASECTNSCPAKCATCTSYYNCKYCKPGFYSGREGDRINSIEYSDCRFACRLSCTKCYSYNNCSSCTIDKFGISCQKGCSVGCYTSCEKDTGSCKCKFGFTGNRCDTCVHGKYGAFCDNFCSDICKDRECMWSSGQCLECITKYFSDKTCSTCINGMHGTYCNQTCPENCKDDMCHKLYGSCSNGCKPNFSGLLCDSCVTGKYGPDCTLDCPMNCYDGRCDRQTGICLSCKTNFKGERCNDCKTGFYTEDCSTICKSPRCKNYICHKTNGTCEECPKGMYGYFCNKTCSKRCFDNICGFKDGVCTLGCQQTFSGDKCCTKNGNCEICSSNKECQTCLLGYYGDNCEAKCSGNCKDGCNNTSEECVRCKLGMHGTFRDSNCSATCEQKVAKSSCDAKSGHCLFGCQVGYHGKACRISCHSNCAGSKCHQDGQCSIGCVNGYKGKTCSQASASTASSIVGPAVGGFAGVVVLISGILVGFFFLRKRRMKLRSCRGAKKDETSFDVSGEGNNYSNVSEVGRPEPLYLEPNKTKKKRLCKEQYKGNENEDLPRYILEETNDETEAQNGQDECYYNMTTNIKVTALFNYVMNKTKDSFKLEFSQLPQKLQKPCSFAKRPENVEKNRYNGIYPYDHSRVQVKGDPTFFINANYIDGFEKERMYIASLGPTKKTTEDFKIFWEMVWHEKADVIVILTNLTELTGMKCEQYWPELNESIQFGDVTVSCHNVDNFAEYTAREFTVSKMTETRNLTHLHYTAWPDKDVPDNVTSLVEFRQRVNATTRSTTGPIIVHCRVKKLDFSAGVGRTGTYIALDRLVEEGEHTASVNVYGCILSMREQRVNMVQTLGQYVYLHKALVHSLTFDCKPIPSEAFVSHVVSMTDASYENQFQHLQQIINEDSIEEQVAVKANNSRLDKNRIGADIPGNRYRPRLYLNRTYNESDYINATHIDSSKKKNHFIIAQTPLPTTVQDFFTMAYQENCSCIVSMGNVTDKEKDIGTYLPSDKQPLSKGCFTVTCVKSETNSQYIQTTLTIKNTGKQEAGEKTFCHFEYKGWKPGAHVPSDAGYFVQFVKDVTSKANTSSEDSSSILVHCLNGVERSGLFCAVAVLLEKIQMEYRISIVNTLRQIMKRRTSAFGNKEQLEFCYNCIAAHLERNNVYANFVS